MKLIALISVTLIGGFIGVLLGFYVPVAVCYVFDAITKPDPGGGLMAVGWIVLFITVPVGAIAGGSLGFLFILNPRKYLKRKITSEPPIYPKRDA